MIRVVGIAAMLAAGTALAGCGAVGGIVDQLTGGSPLDDSSAFAIEVGDCFTEPTADADGFITEIAAAECSLAHDDEAYASVLMADAAFPGDDAALNQAEEECSSRFFDFIGAASDYAGTLNYSYFYPSSGSWDAGDREILCYVYDEAGQTTGSLKGAAS
ncbi:MAG TPA: septum formation family protein [Terrimesophilobacter sp.]|nr:septum formation family protein [Terrimesophilobacter sp.]